MTELGIVDLERLDREMAAPKAGPEEFAPRRRRADRRGDGPAARLAKVGELASEGIAQAYKQVADDLEAAAEELTTECAQACDRARARARQLRAECQATFDDLKSRTAGVRRFARAVETSMAPATEDEMAGEGGIR